MQINMKVCCQNQVSRISTQDRTFFILSFLKGLYLLKLLIYVTLKYGICHHNINDEKERILTVILFILKIL